MKRRVLLVDDDDVMRSMVYGFLDPAYETDAVASGHDALRKLQEKSYDLIISDYNMPGMDGCELTRHVHERYPGLPVLIVSGCDEHDGLFGIGASAYLQKPFSSEQLIASVRAILA